MIKHKDMIKTIFELWSTNWNSIITLAISIAALVLSICSIWYTRNESYLSNRAYVGPVAWNTVDNNQQFQISFTNLGHTPATDFEVTGNLVVENKVIRSTILAEGQTLLPGLESNINPKVPFDFSSDDINKIISLKNSFVQIEFKYKDYLNKPHTQLTNFAVFNISGKYQIQPIKQIIEQ